MKTSDAAGFICADCSNIELGSCNIDQAIVEFENAPWKRELERFEELDGNRPPPCWPDLTFRIGNYHIGFMLESECKKFRVEICMPPQKKLLGIFSFTKFFEFKNVEPARAKEYLKMFYELSYAEQHDYFLRQQTTCS
ncbi:hypothetical protein R50072_38020 [Simiduia litorea]